MSIVCPQCNTENRSIAKFCIECIGTLPPPRPRAPIAMPWQRGDGEAGAAVPFSKGLWVSVAALTVALVVGAAGWLVAGAGGWYLYSAGKAQVHPLPEPTPAAQVAPHSIAAMPAPTPTLTPTVESPVTPAAPLAPVERAVVAPTTVVEKPSQAPAAAAAQAPHPVPTPIRREAPPTTRPQAASSAPSSACTDKGFFAESRCMAQQCEKPQFKAHAQCEEVRRRQRLEEEKRNPYAP
ncbi:hypothetical protein QTH87_03660 [Variovorax sp. J22P168]|uniref:hypothetical protein n=1 Tax=Variovorax jilinensis TaxID=3053513 RepID=UPI0025751C8E|nr:hypothetical protein [Variovorax sp. J22P168]MDM0011529.1 hypothetical protein [Variovorax sp. J22P168]